MPHYYPKYRKAKSNTTSASDVFPQFIEEIRQRLLGMENIVFNLVVDPRGKLQYIATLFVIAKENSRRSCIYIDGGKEVYREQNDDDRVVCGTAITNATMGLHYRPSRCYYESGQSRYFLRPDWKWWYSRTDK